MQSDSLKILFVLNPGSGTKSKTDWETEAHNFFKPLHHTTQFFLLSGKNDADSVRYWLEHFKPDRVVAVGGDGTVNLVAEQLLNTNIPLAILPAGSANGMAKELSIPDSPADALDIILNGDIELSDAILINDKKISIHLSDLGFNAQLIRYFDQRKLRGKLGYLLQVFKTLWRKRLMYADIVIDGKETRRKAFMVVIANASKYGTGALINPEGNLHDGCFEIVIVRRITFLSVLKMFLHFRRFNPKKVELFQGKNVSITLTKKSHFQVDGEYLGRVNHVTAKILPSQLKLILPPKNS